MLSFQMMLFVATLILQSGQGISQISQGRDAIHGDGLCFVACMLIYMVAGLLVSQVKTLQRVAWLANFAVWINMTILLIWYVKRKHGVEKHLPPCLSAAPFSISNQI